MPLNTLADRYVTLLYECEVLEARIAMAKRILAIWQEIEAVSPNAVVHIAANATFKAQGRLADLEHRLRMLERARRIVVRAIVSDLAAGLAPRHDA